MLEYRYNDSGLIIWEGTAESNSKIYTKTLGGSAQPEHLTYFDHCAHLLCSYSNFCVFVVNVM